MGSASWEPSTSSRASAYVRPESPTPQMCAMFRWLPRPLPFGEKDTTSLGPRREPGSRGTGSGWIIGDTKIATNQ
jgi:hypothetical protein